MHLLPSQSRHRRRRRRSANPGAGAAAAAPARQRHSECLHLGVSAALAPRMGRLGRLLRTHTRARKHAHERQSVQSPVTSCAWPRTGEDTKKRWEWKTRGSERGEREDGHRASGSSGWCRRCRCPPPLSFYPFLSCFPRNFPLSLSLTLATPPPTTTTPTSEGGGAGVSMELPGCSCHRFIVRAWRGGRQGTRGRSGKRCKGPASV